MKNKCWFQNRYIYISKGTAYILQEELDTCLALAEEFKIIGLSQASTAIKEETTLTTSQKPDEVYSENGHQGTMESKCMYKMYNKNDSKVPDTRIMILQSSAEELDKTISSLMEMRDKKWACVKCGQQASQKSNMQNHIEAKHIEGMTHQCPVCHRDFRSRNFVKSHISQNHKKLYFSDPETQ